MMTSLIFKLPNFCWWLQVLSRRMQNIKVRIIMLWHFLVIFSSMMHFLLVSIEDPTKFRSFLTVKNSFKTICVRFYLNTFYMLEKLKFGQHLSQHTAHSLVVSFCLLLKSFYLMLAPFHSFYIYTSILSYVCVCSFNESAALLGLKYTFLIIFLLFLDSNKCLYN